MMSQSARYFIPDPSRWPIFGSAALLCMASGAALWINDASWGKFVLIAGFCILIYMLFGWFGTVAHESEGGKYNKQVDTSFRWGMSWFIFSEVMFFAAFFGALFYMRVLSVPDLGESRQQADLAGFHRAMADRRPRHRREIHADGGVGHPGAQYADPAVVRRHRDVGALGPAPEQSRATDLGLIMTIALGIDVPRLPGL